MRLIDGDALVTSLEQSYETLRELCDSIKEGEGAKEIYQGELITFLEAILRVREMPTLDYAPVVHGEWLECACDEPYRYTCNMRYRCSECGRFAVNREPYCHCGALMSGGSANGL